MIAAAARSPSRGREIKMVDKANLHIGQECLKRFHVACFFYVNIVPKKEMEKNEKADTIVCIWTSSA